MNRIFTNRTPCRAIAAALGLIMFGAISGQAADPDNSGARRSAGSAELLHDRRRWRKHRCADRLGRRRVGERGN